MIKRLFLPCLLLMCCCAAGAQTQDSITGVASYYANRFHGRRTASGEKYDKNGYTCAHLKFPFGTMLRVRHLATGKEVVVKVTDRGPYSKRYTIDLSYAAAEELGIVRAGHAKVAIFPFDTAMVHLDVEPQITGFMEFRVKNRKLPHYAFKDTMHIAPIMLPYSTGKEKKQKK